MNRNILRQIADIQVQADRILSGKENIEQVEDFSKYNEEIKKFLLENIEDEFILKFIHEIPAVDFEELDTKNSIFATLLSFLSFGSGTWFQQKKQMDQAIESISNIKGKYASVEFMLRDYINK